MVRECNAYDSMTCNRCQVNSKTKRGKWFNCVKHNVKCMDKHSDCRVLCSWAAVNRYRMADNSDYDRDLCMADTRKHYGAERAVYCPPADYQHTGNVFIQEHDTGFLGAIEHLGSDLFKGIKGLGNDIKNDFVGMYHGDFGFIDPRKWPEHVKEWGETVGKDAKASWNNMGDLIKHGDWSKVSTYGSFISDMGGVLGPVMIVVNPFHAMLNASGVNDLWMKATPLGLVDRIWEDGTGKPLGLTDAWTNPHETFYPALVLGDDVRMMGELGDKDKAWYWKLGDIVMVGMDFTPTGFLSHQATLQANHTTESFMTRLALYYMGVLQSKNDAPVDWTGASEREARMQAQIDAALAGGGSGGGLPPLIQPNPADKFVAFWVFALFLYFFVYKRRDLWMTR